MYNLDNGMFKISTKKISYISIIQNLIKDKRMYSQKRDKKLRTIKNHEQDFRTNFEQRHERKELINLNRVIRWNAARVAEAYWPMLTRNRCAQKSVTSDHLIPRLPILFVCFWFAVKHSDNPDYPVSRDHFTAVYSPDLLPRE